MKKPAPRFAIPCGHFRSLTALALCSLAFTSAAQAADLLGFYLGAAFGEAQVRAQPGRFTSATSNPLPTFDTGHAAYQGMLGIRALSFLGAEVTYVDFGRPSTGSAQASQKGEAAYALLYLPVPVIDAYIKAGISRINTDFSGTYTGTCTLGSPDCGFLTVRGSSTDTAFAYGAGLQWRLGNWAVRGEYERFDAAGANPSLLAIGMTYWFL